MGAQSIKELAEIARCGYAEKNDMSHPFVIAIDGRAASGKTTVAAFLSEELDAAAVHMDDFFLPPELRSRERYDAPGGNIHRERFAEEVLPFIGSAGGFSYRRFDCGAMAYGEEVAVPAKAYRIVEGSYSQHPSFGKYADLTVFVTADAKLQSERVRERDGAEMAEIFASRWIPLEEAYFSAFDIAGKADIIITASENGQASVFDKKRFEDDLRGHIASHPLLQPRDLVKFCYQAAFGAEHMLLDEEKAREFFFREYDSTHNVGTVLFESIGGEYVRVDLAAWKREKRDAEQLFDMFLRSAKSFSNKSDTEMTIRLDAVTKVVSEGATDFSENDWLEYKKEYLAAGIRAVHHSDRYRESYSPAYRVVKAECIGERL